MCDGEQLVQLENKLKTVSKHRDSYMASNARARARSKKLESACRTVLHYFDTIDDSAPWPGLLLAARRDVEEALEQDAA